MNIHEGNGYTIYASTQDIGTQMAVINANAAWHIQQGKISQRPTCIKGRFWPPPMGTLENHCTRTVQSSHGGCSRRVHKIEYLAVNTCKGNILVNFYF